MLAPWPCRWKDGHARTSSRRSALFGGKAPFFHLSLQAMLHAARAANEEVRSRLASASLDAIAPLSTLVSLLLVLLVGASLDGHEWLRGARASGAARRRALPAARAAHLSISPPLAPRAGTSMHLGQPQDALVSLGSVRFGEPSGHGIHFARPTALKRLCVDEGAPLPPRALHAAETDQAIWCAVARAGSTAQSLLWLGYLPLWATAALSAILWLSASVEAARSVRFALAAAGLSDGLFAALLLLGWALSWSFLFAALCAYAHHAPPSLGWASVSLEASFGLLRLAFLVSTLAACALVAKALSLWVRAPHAARPAAEPSAAIQLRTLARRVRPCPALRPGRRGRGAAVGRAAAGEPQAQGALRRALRAAPPPLPRRRQAGARCCAPRSRARALAPVGPPE